jgi:hypothetical protein
VCGFNCPPRVCAQQATVSQFPSGKAIKILSITQYQYPKKLDGTQPSNSLVLNYQSDVDVDDHSALLKEAQGIWPWLELSADADGFTSAILRAHAPAVSAFGVSRDHGFGFVFEKKGQTWIADDDPKAFSAPSRLIGPINQYRWLLGSWQCDTTYTTEDRVPGRGV